MAKDFELLPHTADLKVRVYGENLEQLFTHALSAMFQSIHPIASSCTYENDRLMCPQLPIKREITVTAPDQEALLVDFLSEALYLSDVHNEAFLDVQILKLTPTKIQAVLLGVSINGFERSEIKAVTYHDLHIQEQNGRMQVDIVFDI